MKLKEKGKYFELPIINLKIKEIIYDGLLTIGFDDYENSYLQIHSIFTVTRNNQTSNIHPNQKDGLILFFDHYKETFKNAQADKHGNLWLTFSNETEIFIADGPFENWHYTKIKTTVPMDSLHVHGGVGKIVQ